MRPHGLFAVVSLLYCINSAYGIVCTKDSCNTVRCAHVTEENCNGYIVKNGSSCGCCDVCVEYLNEGDNCTETNSTVPECATETGDDLETRGVNRYTAVCKPPNECIGGKCTEPERSGAKPPQASQDHGCEQKYPQPSEHQGCEQNRTQPSKQYGRKQKPPQDYEHQGYEQKPPQPSENQGCEQNRTQGYEHHGYEQKPPQPSEYQGYEQKPPQPSEYQGYEQKPPQPSEYQGCEQKPQQGYGHRGRTNIPPQVYVQ